MSDNILQNKSFQFSIKIIEAYKILTDDKEEYILSEQLLKSGTGIGANVEYALSGQNRTDFFSSMALAFKEAKQTKYWLMLLQETNYLSEADSTDLISDCEEICRIIFSIQKNANNNS